MTSEGKPARDGAVLSGPAVWAFSCINLPVLALTLAVMVHLPRYFASHLGISLAAVGSAFAIVRLIDIPVDPALGLMMDRTRSRFGRYRLWTVLGVPILMFGVYMLVEAPRAGSVGQGYLIGWLLVMYLGLSILLLAHASWAATLATNYHERSRIFGIIAAVGVIGAAVVLLIPIIAAEMGLTDAQGVQAMGWFIMALTPLAVAAAVWRTPERVIPDHNGRRFGLRDYVALLTRSNVLRLLISDIFIRLGPLWMGALYLFFLKDSRGFGTTEASLLLMIYVLAGFAGAPATAWVARRIGKHRALMLTTTAYSLLLLSIMVLPKGVFLAYIPTLFLTGALAAGFDVVIRALTADIGDELRLESGKEWMGMLYALTNASAKVAGAFSIYLTFHVLEAVGYLAQEGAVNTPQAIRGLEVAYLAGPIICVMLGGACFIGYRLDATRHADIRRQLDARDS